MTKHQRLSREASALALILTLDFRVRRTINHVIECTLSEGHYRTWVMPPAIELPFHPTVSDCLAWSPDGELAIAAGEFVHILVMI